MYESQCVVFEHGKKVFFCLGVLLHVWFVVVGCVVFVLCLCILRFHGFVVGFLSVWYTCICVKNVCSCPVVWAFGVFYSCLFGLGRFSVFCCFVFLLFCFFLGCFWFVIVCVCWSVLGVVLFCLFCSLFVFVCFCLFLFVLVCSCLFLLEFLFAFAIVLCFLFAFVSLCVFAGVFVWCCLFCFGFLFFCFFLFVLKHCFPSNSSVSWFHVRSISFLISVFSSCFFLLSSLLLVSRCPIFILCVLCLFLFRNPRRCFDSLHLVFWFLFVLLFLWHLGFFVFATHQKATLRKGEFPKPLKSKMHKKDTFTSPYACLAASQECYLLGPDQEHSCKSCEWIAWLFPFYQTMRRQSSRLSEPCKEC